MDGGADELVEAGSTSCTSSVQQRIVIVTAVQTVLRGHVWTVGFVTEQSSGVATYLRMLWLFKAGLITRWEKQEGKHQLVLGQTTRARPTAVSSTVPERDGNQVDESRWCRMGMEGQLSVAGWDHTPTQRLCRWRKSVAYVPNFMPSRTCAHHHAKAGRNQGSRHTVRYAEDGSGQPPATSSGQGRPRPGEPPRS